MWGLPAGREDPPRREPSESGEVPTSPRPIAERPSKAAKAATLVPKHGSLPAGWAADEPGWLATALPDRPPPVHTERLEAGRWPAGQPVTRLILGCVCTRTRSSGHLYSWRPTGVTLEPRSPPRVDKGACTLRPQLPGRAQGCECVLAQSREGPRSMRVTMKGQSLAPQLREHEASARGRGPGRGDSPRAPHSAPQRPALLPCGCTGASALRDRGAPSQDVGSEPLGWRTLVFQGEILSCSNPLFSHPSERSLNSSFTRSSAAEAGTCFSPNCPEKQRTRLLSRTHGAGRAPGQEAWPVTTQPALWGPGVPSFKPHPHPHAQPRHGQR